VKKTKAKVKTKAKAKVKVKTKTVAKAKAKVKAKAKPKKKVVAKRVSKPVKKKAAKKIAAEKKVAKKVAPKKIAPKKIIAKKVAKPAKAKSAAVVEIATSVIPKPKWSPQVEALLFKLDEAKAEQIVTMDVRGKSTEADTMIVASGRSNRHVNAIADQAVEELSKHGVKNIRIEGVPQCDWVLVDAGDILLHVFRPEVRSFYNLEKLWSAQVPE
jgi:ribosome-associated protein